MITGTAWDNDLYARFVSIGFKGSYLHKFTGVIGNGSAAEVVGKTFTTTDVGTVPGAGTGAGVGIVGISAATISNTIYSLAVSYFGQAGARLKDTCDQIADSCVAQMALATLSSTHTPVYLGTGTIVVGSITVDPGGWSSLITSQGVSNGFKGSQWPNLAEAVGTGQAMGVLSSGTGIVTITGSGGPPVGGSGNGFGVMS